MHGSLGGVCSGYVFHVVVKLEILTLKLNSAFKVKINHLRNQKGS